MYVFIRRSAIVVESTFLVAFFVLSRSFSDFSFDVGAFVIGLSQIFLLFLLFINISPEIHLLCIYYKAISHKLLSPIFDLRGLIFCHESCRVLYSNCVWLGKQMSLWKA